MILHLQAPWRPHGHGPRQTVDYEMMVDDTHTCVYKDHEIPCLDSGPFRDSPSL